MSVNAIEKALWQSSKNAADAKRFREDPHSYLKEFRIDEDERWLLAEWDVSGLINRGVHPMIIMMAFQAVNGGAYESVLKIVDEGRSTSASPAT